GAGAGRGRAVPAVPRHALSHRRAGRCAAGGLLAGGDRRAGFASRPAKRAMSRIAAVINPAKFDPAELLPAIRDRAGAEVGCLLTTEQDPGAGQARQAVADGAELV